MKKIINLILANLLFIFYVSGQNIIEKIETAYNNLDSLSYIDKVNLVIYKDIEKRFGKVDEKQNDSIVSRYLKPYSTFEQLVNSMYENIIKKTEDKRAIFVLNVIGDLSIEDFIEPDAIEFNFNIYFFNRHLYPDYYIFFMGGELEIYGSAYPTFSKLIAKNIKRFFRQISKKNPVYLLRCDKFEGMNTILYVLKDQIYVYRISQNKEYELEEYVQHLTKPKYFYGAYEFVK